MGGGGEKTEQATPKRKSDERKKGNVFKSQEIITLGGLLAVVYTLMVLGDLFLRTLARSFDTFWGAASSANKMIPSDLQHIFVQGSIIYIFTAVPPLLMAGLAAVVLTMAQTRGLVSGKAVSPKFSKLNPINGFKKMFSLRGVIELLKSIIKIVILGYVIYNKYMERFNELPRLMEMEYGQVLYYAAQFFMDILLDVAVIYAFLAAADYLYQRWQYNKDLRMTKQEIKEEYKQTEGDPQIKGKIRQKQREMATGRMMQNVPEADVVIRNPTHYAVAIRYEAGKNTAPVVLAKGVDYLALRIIRIAEENKVTVVENRPLARGLYENVPLDREISEDFFQPVAEVLAFVYSTAKKEKLPVQKDDHTKH